MIGGAALDPDSFRALVEAAGRVSALRMQAGAEAS